MAKDGIGRPTKEQADEKKRLNKWNNAIAAYERTFKSWEGRVEKIIDKYRDERTQSGNSRARFNILWSNVQTLVPATFSRLPMPDVSRRFRDNDPVGRVASLILERALDYEVQHYPDYRATLKSAVQDRFLGGRGTAWARYEPHISAVKQGLPTDGDQITEDVDEPEEQLDYECAPVDYVHWRDFGHTIARTWEEVTGVWRRVYLTREACVERFGEKLGNEIPLDSTPEDQKKTQLAESGDYARALIYEIWDKQTKKAMWLSKTLGKFLDTKDDPLGLEGFFPCPKPLYATTTNESLIPVPDFALYQDQAKELDTLSDRIDGLVQALQVKGTYDASVPELARIFTEASNTNLIPVKNWAAFVEKNGLQGAISLVDLTPIANALKVAYEAFANIIEKIYQITGISDIIRGQTDPNETLGAQKLKGQYASLRLKDYQNQVAQFATEALRFKAQIICAKYAPENLMKMAAVDQLSDADKQYVPQAMQLLLGDRVTDPDCDCPNPLRSFRVDIAADTLVEMDEQAEQQSRTEFLTAVGGYLEKAFPIVQAAPEAGGLVVQLLKFGVTGFKVGKQIEGEIDQALDQLKQAALKPKPPPVDPAMEKVKADAAAKQQEMQQEAQSEQQRIQSEERRNAQESQQEQAKLAMEQFFERQRIAMEEAATKREAVMQAMLEKWKAELQAKTEVEKAHISAEASVKAAKERPTPNAD